MRVYYQYNLTISQKTDLTINTCDSPRDIVVEVYDFNDNVLSNSVCSRSDGCPNGQCSNSWNEYYTLSQIEPDLYFIVIYLSPNEFDPGSFQLSIECESLSSSITTTPFISTTSTTWSTTSSSTSSTGTFL